MPIERHGRPRPCERRGLTIVGRMSASEPFDGSTVQGRRYDNVLQFEETFDAKGMFCGGFKTKANRFRCVLIYDL